MQPARRRAADREQRATFIELFFDLVFVFVVTQLSSLLVHNLTLRGAGEAAFLLLLAWWAWIYTTWMTNWFDPDDRGVRAVLFVAALASMFGGIAVTDAFGGRALLLVAGYVGIQSFRNWLLVLETRHDDPLYRPLLRIAAWNSWVGALWLAGALVDEPARVVVWLVALVADYGGPFAGHWTPGLGRTAPEEWDLEPSHFVERIELFVIIALGESIVAAGGTAAALPLTLPRVAAVTVAFLTTAALWWLYFDFHAERAVHALRVARRGRGIVGRDLSYLHIPLVAGIIVNAVGDKLVLARPGERLGGAELVALAAGPALYLLGSVLFKLRVVHFGIGKRLVAVLLVVGAGALGTALPAVATEALMLAVLVGLAVAEALPAAQRRRAQVLTAQS
jgi:low temperature requirement protein LtrA